jgi:hypothetical protein
MPVARVGPKALLSLCHEVDELSEKIREFSAFGLRHLDIRRQRAVKRIRSALHGPQKDAFRATLRTLKSEYSLCETEILLLLLLFNRRVRKANPSATGRDLLEALTSHGSDIIEMARFLHPDMPLVSAGLVTGAAATAEDALDGEFRISDRSYSALYRAYHGLPVEVPDFDEAAPYANAIDHLLDFRVLCDLTKRRAGKLFPMSAWGEWAADDQRDTEELSTRFDRLRSVIAAREKATPESVRLPIVALRTEFGLSEDEEVIVLTLLQHELFAARATFELVELVRLVSTSEEDALRKRGLVAADGRLRQSGLIAAEDDPIGKDLFGAAWLPAWVSDRLLATLDPKGKIGSQERTSFAKYLEGLRNSDDFYRRL